MSGPRRAIPGIGTRAGAERLSRGRLASASRDEGAGGRRASPIFETCLAAALWLALASPAPAIVGGREAGESVLARSSVMVLTEKGGVCTGLVVARAAVLTAGHCVAGFARNRIHLRDEAGAPVRVEAAARAVHPAYDPDPVTGRTRSIDLALLRLRQPLPARHAPARLSAAMPQAGAGLTLGGYGASRGGDARSLGRFRLAELPVVAPHGPSASLVWLHASGRGGCTGDSGGPISDREGTLALAAWVKDHCGGQTQGTLLGPQRDWIDRTLAGWGLSAQWSR